MAFSFLLTSPIHLIFSIIFTSYGFSIISASTFPTVFCLGLVVDYNFAFRLMGSCSGLMVSALDSSLDSLD